MFNQIEEILNSSSNDQYDLSQYTSSMLIEKLEQMILIRATEQIIASLILQQKAKCPCHLGIGQEAIAVGISHSLKPRDRVFGAHRSHSHYLALGGDPLKLIAEILGRVTGCAKGMGGSMHIFAPEKGFYGSVPIVAGTVPLAVGAALAAKKDGLEDIAVAYLGDGACEEGIVHESFNLAALMNLPILFVVENNLFSSHMDIELRQPCNRMSRFAEANHIQSVTLDGNNLGAVLTNAEKMIKRMRSNRAPAFIEAITYRWSGHVGASDDIDVGVHRSMNELKAWKEKDPIKRVNNFLVENKYIHPEYEAEFYRNQMNDLESLVEKANKDPYPEKRQLLETVYST